MRCVPAAGPVFFPLDEELGLVPGSLTPLLREWLVRLGSWATFAPAAQMLTEWSGALVTEPTGRRSAEAAGDVAVRLQTEEMVRVEQERLDGPPGPAVQQLSVDGAFVPLVGGEWAEVKTVAVGVVEQETIPRGGVAVHTRAVSYFSRMTSAADFERQALVELHRRGIATAGKVAAVQDGAVWQQSFVDYHRPDAVRILDFCHAAEHLSTAVKAALGPGTAATSAWLDQQLHELKHGDPDRVLAAVRELPAEQARDAVEAVALRDATLGYLERRRAQLAYATFQEQGLPIGSGIAESGNKLVVEARLKGSGMHWAPEHVNPLLALRNIVCSDRWGEAWPQVASRLHTAAVVRQHPRRTQRPDSQTTAAPTHATPVVSPSQEPAASAPPPEAAKLVVNGHPTSNHPWKGPSFASRERRTPSAHAKL